MAMSDGKSAMRFDKAACRLCLLGNTAKLERVQIFAEGELLMDSQKRDARSAIDLEDVKFEQAVDILTVFDLVGNETEQAEALPQEIVEQQLQRRRGSRGVGTTWHGRFHLCRAAERLEIIRYGTSQGFLKRHKSGRLTNNFDSGKRAVHILFASKHSEVAVGTIAWCPQSEQQCWQEMLGEDPDLKKKLGDGWGSMRSCAPSEWAYSSFI